MCKIKMGILFILLTPVILAAAEKPLRIYLPQEKQLDDTTVLLGRIGILMGDPAMVDKAKALALGTFSAQGQTLSVDRKTILSRLASAGIRAQQVQILGAERVRIGRNEVIISPEQITACAQRYLEAQLASVKGVALTVLRAPQPVVLTAASGAVELSAQDDAAQSGGVRKVCVAVIQDRRPAAVQDVFFTVRYRVRRVVAAVELPAGTVLTSENIQIETVHSDQPEPDGWTVPYGMATRQRIAAGGTVSEALLDTPQAPVLVRKRQGVLVRMDNGQLFVSAAGEAMDDGAVGQVVRVRRGQRPQERIITCRVMPDGSVEPVF